MTKPAQVLALAAGAAFLALLDVTVVNLAIPSLAHAYPHATVSGLSWVLTAYATLFAALLAPAGRVADIVGRRRLFRLGVAAFAVLSAACAAAPSLPVLLVARGLQGAAAALMIPASLSIVLTDTPAERRMAAIGVWSAAGAFAAAVGPTLGGILVHLFGWRSLFVINVPAGLALAALGRQLPLSARTASKLPDLPGTLLLGAGVGLAALGLSQGSRWGWGDMRTLLALAAGAGSAAAAIVRSWRRPVPAIETRLWRHRTFALANGASLLYGASLYAWMLLGVLVLTELWRYSVLQAGLAMTPGAVTASIAAVLAGRVRGPGGPRAVTVSGALLMALCGFLLAATLPAQPDFLGYWLPIGLVLGAGMGLITTGTSTAAALSLPPTAFAAGTGLNQTARQIGGALGIATLATLLRSGSATSASTFAHVYLFCASVIVAAALVGLGLRLRSVAPAPPTEADDPFLGVSPPLVRRWRRVAVLGDSVAAGVGDAVPGYRHLGWADRVAEGLEARYLNLGRRDLMAADIRATQLRPALDFRPDLAFVVGGGNDLLRRRPDVAGAERELDTIVAALHAAGCDVVMLAPFDMSRTSLLPEDAKGPWRALIGELSGVAERVAERHGALFVDFRDHPAGADPGIYSRDRMHLNARGHAICAAHMLRVLEQHARRSALQAA